ncbi:MAG: hypothetical protein U0640_09395 [Phycisphaerales bacterium]
MPPIRFHPPSRPLLALGVVAALLPACTRHAKPAPSDLSPPATLSLTNAPDSASSGRGVDIRLWVLSPQSPVETNAKSGPFRESKGTSRPAAAADALASLVALADEYEASLGVQPGDGDGTSTLDALSATANKPLDARTIATLKRNGFRAFTIPITTLERVRQRVKLALPEQQQIIAFSNSRSEVVRGPAFATSQAFDLDSGVFTVEAGHIRMLLRSWPVPLEAKSGASALRAERTAKDSRQSTTETTLEAAVRVELVPQAVPKVGPASKSLFALHEAQSIAAESAGPVFSRLTLEATLPADLALVMFAPPEQSQAEQQPVQSQPVDEVPPEAKIDDASDRPAAKIVKRSDIGPEVPTLPTLGQALLTDSLNNPAANEFIVLVFIPRPPAQFSLLK